MRQIVIIIWNVFTYTLQADARKINTIILPTTL